MNNNELIQENFNSSLEVENPFVLGTNPFESPDIVNNSGSYSTPVLDSPNEPTNVSETQSLIEVGEEINSDTITSSSDLLTGITNSAEPLLNVASDFLAPVEADLYLLDPSAVSTNSQSHDLSNSGLRDLDSIDFDPDFNNNDANLEDFLRENTFKILSNLEDKIVAEVEQFVEEVEEFSAEISQQVEGYVQSQVREIDYDALVEELLVRKQTLKNDSAISSEKSGEFEGSTVKYFEDNRHNLVEVEGDNLSSLEVEGDSGASARVTSENLPSSDFSGVTGEAIDGLIGDLEARRDTLVEVEGEGVEQNEDAEAEAEVVEDLLAETEAGEEVEEDNSDDENEHKHQHEDNVNNKGDRNLEGNEENEEGEEENEEENENENVENSNEENEENEEGEEENEEENETEFSIESEDGGLSIEYEGPLSNFGNAIGGIFGGSLGSALGGQAGNFLGNLIDDGEVDFSQLGNLIGTGIGGPGAGNIGNQAGSLLDNLLGDSLDPASFLTNLGNLVDLTGAEVEYEIEDGQVEFSLEIENEDEGGENENEEGRAKLFGDSLEDFFGENGEEQIIAAAPLAAPVAAVPGGVILLGIGVGGIVIYENREPIAQFSLEALRNIQQFTRDLSDIIVERGGNAIDSLPENVREALSRIPGFDLDSAPDPEVTTPPTTGNVDIDPNPAPFPGTGDEPITDPTSGGIGTDVDPDLSPPFFTIGDNEVFTNQYPDQLEEELETAEEAGVTPMEVGASGFDNAIEIDAGQIKWVVTTEGKLLIVPKIVNGQEISHAVINRGRPVIAAGEASIIGSDGVYILLEISNRSGHYRPSKESVEIGKEAFKASGVNVDSVEINTIE